MTRTLVILLTSLALGGVATAAPEHDDDDSDAADPVDPYAPAPGPAPAPAPRGGQARLGIAVGGGQNTAIVDAVMPGSAAERAGLRVGDQIVQVAGSPVASADAVVQVIAGHRAGDSVSISVLRDGQRLELRAMLDADRGGPRAQRPPRWNRGFQQPPPGRDPWRAGPGPRGGAFGGDLELRRQLDEANRRIDELEKRIRELERTK
jgi:hypothetical protein